MQRQSIILRSGAVLLALLTPIALAAQTASGDPQQAHWNQILERLDRLEKQNQSLEEEIRQLRQELVEARGEAPVQAAGSSQAPAPPPLAEKETVDQNRIAELAQSKVEASQRFPIRITGMAVFNGFLNSKGSGGMQYPTYAWPGSEASGGGSFYQTTLGLEYSGPRTFLGGQVHGDIYMDFAGGSGTALNLGFRLRTGEVQIDWANQSLMAGVEPPLIAARSPASLAQVEFAPLSAAGNLWLWAPQVRFEQKLAFTEHTGVRAQVAAIQTIEVPPYLNAPLTTGVEPVRPGLEGRLEFYHGSREGPRIEIAPGFHTSVTHVRERSAASHLFSLDWFTNPLPKMEFSGTFYTGQNDAPLGGLEGFTILPSGAVIPVPAKGGWAQLTLLPTSRLSVHLFSGLETGQASDLNAYSIGRNWLYGANLFYRMAPNVLLGIEASQARTAYIDSSLRLNNHYDLALAYLF